MGEMADLVADSWDCDSDFYDYLHGELTDQEAYERGVLNELGGIAGTERQPKTCRCCGKAGLHWEKLKGKWRLFDDKGLHNCPVNPLRD